MFFKKKYPPMQDGFEEYGTQDDWEKMIDGMHEHERHQRWKAIKSLFDKEAHDMDFPYIWPYLIVGFIALVLNRGYKDLPDGRSDYEYEDVTHWDYQKLYAGYDMQCLSVNLKKVRFHQFKDGDWWL